MWYHNRNCIAKFPDCLFYPLPHLKRPIAQTFARLNQLVLSWHIISSPWLPGPIDTFGDSQGRSELPAAGTPAAAPPPFSWLGLRCVICQPFPQPPDHRCHVLAALVVLRVCKTALQSDLLPVVVTHQLDVQHRDYASGHFRLYPVQDGILPSPQFVSIHKRL